MDPLLELLSFAPYLVPQGYAAALQISRSTLLIFSPFAVARTLTLRRRRM